MTNAKQNDAYFYLERGLEKSEEDDFSTPYMKMNVFMLTSF